MRLNQQILAHGQIAGLFVKSHKAATKTYKHKTVPLDSVYNSQGKK